MTWMPSSDRRSRPINIAESRSVESVFARAALVRHEFLDDYPAHYDTYANRHRWTRGDWQIAHWLRSTVRDAHGRKKRNPISVISR
jgi:hypothetical protein